MPATANNCISVYFDPETLGELKTNLKKGQTLPELIRLAVKDYLIKQQS